MDTKSVLEDIDIYSAVFGVLILANIQKIDNVISKASFKSIPRYLRF